jgi:TP901 family phage tail tape measure protein
LADVNANIGVNIDTSAALAQLKSLQRQISQFHTSIAKSSESAALAQRDLQKNFLNSVNSIGAFSAELRTVKTTAESFTDSLQKNKFSMREYFRYAGASTKTFGKVFKSEFDTIGKVAEDRVKRLQTQYIKLGRDTSGAMKAIAIMPNQLDMGNFSTQSQIAAQKQAIFNQLVKQGSTNLLNFGKNTQWAGRQLMVGFTLPLATLGTVATRTFMEMEAQTLKFRKVYGDLFTPKEETQRALADITALGEMFTKYGVAVSQTVGLAAEAAAAGFSGIDLQRQTTEATRLSVLGQIESNKALETTISLQNAFKMSSDQLASSIDFLNAVENQTVVSLDDITTAIPKVAPVIQQLGGDVKDLAFFMAAMKEGGINASEGANALKSGLAALINPPEKASAMLAGYGINIKQIIEGNQGDLKTTVVQFAEALDTLDPLTRARAIEQLFGKFQFARLSTLFDNVTNQAGQAGRVLELAGTSVEDLAALSNQELGVTADSAMNKFRKSVEDLKLSLVPVGQTFLEAVTPIVEFVGGILEKFNNLSSGVKKALVVLTVAIGAIGPIALMTFGLLANGLANIVKGALVLRNGYLRLTGQTQILGEQTEYLTMEQIDATAASHSLDQSHARLVQTFTAESSAIAKLIQAYQQATVAGAKFAAINPGMMRAPGAPTSRTKGFADGGIVRGPGSGTSDSILAMLSNGEAVIPAKIVKQFPELITGLVSGNIPGFKKGTAGLNIERAHATGAFSQSSVQFQAALDMVAGLRELNAQFPNMVRVVSNLTAELPLKLNQAMKQVMLRGGKSSGGASIAQFESEYGSLSGKFSASAKRGGADISSPGMQTALLDFEKRVGERAVELANGTKELKVTDDLFTQATRETINEFALIEGNAKKVATALDQVSKQVGQIRIQPSQSQYREGLTSGAFSIDPTGKVARFGSIDVARPKSQTKSGLAAARPASNINLPGNYTTGKDLAVQATQVTNEAILATAQAAGTNSPSRKTIPIGEDIARGLQVGMANQQDEVAASGQALAAAAVGGTQSGGARQRRSASRPQGAPRAIGLSGAANSAVSPAIKDAIDTEITARKTSAQRIDSMNRALMGGTFALTSLASVGSMAGGTVGNLSQQVMKFSGLLFALMSVTQLLTQTKIMELATTRATTVASAMGAANLKSLFGAGGGIAGFGKNLLTAGKFLLRFLGPIGLATTAMIATVSVIKMVNAARERERLSIEGLGDAALLSSDKLKALGDIFNVVPQTTAFEKVGQSASLIPQQASQIQSVRSNEEFQKAFEQDIKSLKNASFDQATLIFQSLSLQLKGKGFAKEQVQTIIDALQEESGKTSLKFDVASIDLTTDTGMEKFKSTLTAISTELGKQFATGYSSEVKSGFSRATGETVTWTEETISKDLKRSINLTGKSFKGFIVGLSGQLASGTISAEKFRNSFARISSTLGSMPKAQSLLVLNQIMKDLDPNTVKAVNSLDKFSNKMLLLRAQAVGLTFNLAGVAEAMNTMSDPKAFGPDKDVFAKKKVDDFIASLKKAEEAFAKYFDTQKDGTIGGDSGGAEKFDLTKYIGNNITAIKNQTQAFKQMRMAGIAAATAAELASNPDAAKAIISLAKTGGNAWKEATAQIKEYTKAQKYLDQILLAGAEAGDYELGRLQMASKYIALQEHLLDLQTSPKLKAYRDELVFQELILKNIGDKIKSITDAEIVPRETLIKQNNYKLEELSLIEDEINKSYDEQVKALQKIESVNKNINALQKARLTIADALTRGDISAAVMAVDQARQDQAATSLSDAQEQLSISKELVLNSLGRKELEQQNKILQLQISQIQKNQIDAMERAKSQVGDRVDALNYEVYVTEKLLQMQKDSIKYFGMTREQIEAATKSLELAKDAGIDINVTGNLQAFINAAKGDTDALLTLLNTTVPTAAKAAFDKLAEYRDAMDLSATITVSVAGDGAVASIDAVTAAWDKLNAAADAAAKARIIMAQFQIDQVSFDDFVKKVDEIDAKIKQMLKDAADILKDGIITDEELAAFAAKWGLALDQAKKFLTDVDAMFKAAVIDKSAIEAFAKAWGIPYDAAVKYLTDANAYLLSGTIDDTTLQAFATKWGLPYEAVKAYLTNTNKDLSETDLDSTSITEYAAKWAEPKNAFNSYKDSVTTGVTSLNALDYSSPGNSAASGWNTATAAANSYAVAAAAAAQAQRDLAVATAAATAAAASSTSSSSSTTDGSTASSSGATPSGFKSNTGIAFRTVDDARQANELYLALQAAIKAYDEQNKKGPSANLGTLLSKKNEAQKVYDAFVKAKKLAFGGVVTPKYMKLGGFAMGSDTVPAMLTPGEFVVRRPAVQGFGVKNLEKINNGEYESGSVYNYSLSVNVNSDANPNDIARAVITQIKQIDSQRVRGQRV